MEFSDFDSVKQYVSDCFASILLENYNKTFDELVEWAAREYIDYLRDEHGYRYGDAVPSDDIDLFDYIRDFEV